VVGGEDLDVGARLAERDPLGEGLVVPVLGVGAPPADAVLAGVVGAEDGRERAVELVEVLFLWR